LCFAYRDKKVVGVLYVFRALHWEIKEEGFTVTQYASFTVYFRETPIAGLQQGTIHYDAYASLRDVENIIAATKDKEDRQNYYGTALVIKS
jgi:hypothetical protein